MVRILLLMILLPVFLTACREKVVPAPEEPSKIDGISDHWVLYRVQQIDVDVKRPLTEQDSLLDISDDYLTATPVELVFAKEGMVYALLPGKGSAFFNLPGGAWSFDNDKYPTRLLLNKGTSNAVSFGLLQSVRPQDPNLVLKHDKLCSGKRTASYHLWFRRK